MSPLRSCRLVHICPPSWYSLNVWLCRTGAPTSALGCAAGFEGSAGRPGEEKREVRDKRRSAAGEYLRRTIREGK
jgi:hypothetical protein